VSASTSAKLELLKHPSLWRAGQLAAQQTQAQQGISTGYAQLDSYLLAQGWPVGGLVEIMLPSAGIGELRLLMPALQSLSQKEKRWLAWINPPFIPYAPALVGMGIDVDKILLIRTQDHKDALWALERACKSATCSTVFAWLEEKQLKLKDTQRLQLAAKQGRTLTCLFRPEEAQKQSSMAELRLILRSNREPGSVLLDIIKRRGGWPVIGITLSVAEVTASAYRQDEELQKQLSLWRTQQASTQNNKPKRDYLPPVSFPLDDTRPPQPPTLAPPVH